MIIQITYSIKLLHNSNYIHGDFHLGNIGWIKTNKKYIILDRIKIKTFGYQFKLIDFGFVLSKFDITNKREEKNYNELINKELGYLLYCFVDNKFLEWFNKNNLKYDFTKLYNQLKKTDEFKIINKFTSNKNDQIFLYDILFQEQYQKIICGNNYKKTIIRKLFIPIQDILVFVKIYQYPDLVIKYFNNKI
jgi:predicted unusual protein kinase regulating ubiquinone biosynthesis (AarF/ABC1/UbiB family)